MRFSSFRVGLALVAAASVRVSAQVSDVTPPQLQAVAISPTSVDVSASSKTVTVDMGVTDNLSGVDTVIAILVAPNGTMAQSRATSLDGYTYRATITIPRYAANGTWLLRITLVDGVNNRAVIGSNVLQSRGLPFSISVASSPVDVTPPVPVGISFSPSTVDVSTQAQDVTVQIRVNDDLSGVVVDPTIFTGFTLVVQSPVGQQIRLYNVDFAVTGTPLASIWQATFQVPHYADAAAWQIVQLRVTDAAGNDRFLSAADLANLGVAPQLIVTSTISDRTAPTLAGFSFSPTVINTALGPQVVHVKLDIRDDLAGVSFAGRTLFNRLFFTSPSGQSV